MGPSFLMFVCHRARGYAAILSAAMIFLFTGHAIADFLDGNQLLQNCTSDRTTFDLECTGYIEGVADHIRGQTSCLDPNVTVGQLRAVTLAYIRANPAKRHSNAASLVAAALNHAFPCR